MENIVYPTQKMYIKGLLWLQRLASLVFLYATLTLPAGIQLMDTPLVTTLRDEYPTWWHVILDMGITMFVLGGLLFLTKLLLLYTRSHPVSKKWIARVQKIESRVLQNFLNFDFFLVKFLLATALSFLLWFLLKPVVAMYDNFHVPHYSDQPVVFVMVMLGLIVFVESFQSWKLKMRKHIHLTERF